MGRNWATSTIVIKIIVLITLFLFGPNCSKPSFRIGISAVSSRYFGDNDKLANCLTSSFLRFEEISWYEGRTGEFGDVADGYDQGFSVSRFEDVGWFGCWWQDRLVQINRHYWSTIFLRSCHFLASPSPVIIIIIKSASGFDTLDSIFTLNEDAKQHIAALGETTYLTSSLMTNENIGHVDAAKVWFLLTRTQYTLLSPSKHMNARICRLVPTSKYGHYSSLPLWLVSLRNLWWIGTYRVRRINETTSQIRINDWSDLMGVFDTFLWDERVHETGYTGIWDEAKRLEAQQPLYWIVNEA